MAIISVIFPAVVGALEVVGKGKGEFRLVQLCQRRDIQILNCQQLIRRSKLPPRKVSRSREREAAGMIGTMPLFSRWGINKLLILNALIVFEFVVSCCLNLIAVAAF